MSKKTKSAKSSSGKKTTTTPAAPDRVPPTQIAKQAKRPKARKPSGLDAAAQVLKDAGTPMRCGDIVAKMLSTGLWKTKGRTPASTIHAAIAREVQTKGDKSRFKKTDRGLFTVNAR